MRQGRDLAAIKGRLGGARRPRGDDRPLSEDPRVRGGSVPRGSEASRAERLPRGCLGAGALYYEETCAPITGRPGRQGVTPRGIRTKGHGGAGSQK
jgi:hypothetical protein